MVYSQADTIPIEIGTAAFGSVADRSTVVMDAPYVPLARHRPMKMQKKNFTYWCFFLNLT